MDIKERIIQKAESMFFRYGVKAVTMDDIARELGISKKTIYLHFPDKDELVMQVVGREMHRDQCEYEEMESSGINSVEKFIQASEMMRQTLVNVNPRLLYEIQKYHPRAWQLFQEHMQEFALKGIEKELHRGISEKLFRSNLDVPVIARLRLKQIEMGFDNQLFPPEHFPLLRVQNEFLDHFMRGIVTEQGCEIYERHQKELINQPKSNVK
ncbi:MAG: TetR/AcrR family transcriptional regulator [Cytophagaceae bacterium]|nr:TetR/AcrR family transcriptional regulator [Cytophagaceae bacterium]